MLWEQEHEGQNAVYVKHWNGYAWRDMGGNSTTGFGFIGEPASISRRAMTFDAAVLYPVITY